LVPGASAMSAAIITVGLRKEGTTAGEEGSVSALISRPA